MPNKGFLHIAGSPNEGVARVAALPLAQVRLLAGPFKARQEVHGRYLLMVEADRLLAPFREQAGLPRRAEPYGGWEARDIRGHSLGHYLSALALHYASTGDRHLVERIAHVVSELGACQQANGDGYVLPVDKGAFEQLREGRIETSNFSLNGVWVPFYTLHKLFAGLRDAHRYAGNIQALDVERRMADWLDGVLAPLTDEQIQQVLVCEHGGMNEVLADLAVDTGDARYLAMAARDFHHAAVLDPMLRGENNLDGLHANTQIPKLVGLAREFELGGAEPYRLAVETFWDQVVRHRSYVNGGHSESEHFFPVEQFPQKLTPFTCETCNTYNMLKLTGHLFSWAPSAEQMDFVERALINHLLANIGRQPGEFGYFLGLASVGLKVFSTPFDSWWCCVGTGLENPSRYGEQIYFHNQQELWVNLFISSALDWPERGLQLRQETQFPDEETVRLSFVLEQPARFTLRLRHPYWCSQPELRVNGERLELASAPSSYLAIERTWRDGDTLELRLPMELHLEPLTHSDGTILAVMFGPTVLAGLVPDDAGGANAPGMRFSDHLAARGKTDALPPHFVAPSADEVRARLRPTGTFAEFRSDGVVKPGDLTFVPFYRVYEEAYAVYFPLLTADEWAQREAQIRTQQEQLLRLEAATCDSVAPGHQQPEVEHRVQAQNSTTGDFHGRKFREARDGWLSYELAVDGGEPMALVATYWGAEWGARRFEILVDGQKVATQALHADKPGDFFDVPYLLPISLTRGKASVTVRFQSAEPGSLVGRLFGLQMMRAEALQAGAGDAPLPGVQ